MEVAFAPIPFIPPVFLYLLGSKLVDVLGSKKQAYGFGNIFPSQDFISLVFTPFPLFLTEIILVFLSIITS
jgi:hypothetical protein